MTSQESSSNSQGQQYMSKKVIINGQFVTLYSLNGLTWLSSPEDLQDTMARLDNTRVTLNEEKGEKDEKGEKADKDAKTEKAPPVLPKLASSQYRMKGPKPRPILRQGGKAIEGAPVEVPSAAAVNVKSGLDPIVPQVKLTPSDKSPRRAKLVAPIAQKRPGQVKQPKTPPPAKVAAPVKGAKGKPTAPVAPVVAKGAKKGIPAPVAKGKKAAPAPAPKAVKAAAAPKKSAKPAKVVKQVKKAAAKPVKAKKPAPKSSGKKSSKR